MKTKIKLVNKDLMVILNDCKKVIEIFNYFKDGTPCIIAKERVWKSTRFKNIYDLVEYYKSKGFMIEYIEH